MKMDLTKIREEANKLWVSCQKDKRRLCDLTHNDWDNIIIKAME